MRTVAWLNKKYKTLHLATGEPFSEEVRAELMPLCDQEAAEAVIYARGATIKDELREAERLRAALTLAVQAMRAPLDGWKGELERKALDAANAALGPNDEAHQRRNEH